jgi:hypothetical protein
MEPTIENPEVPETASSPPSPPRRGFTAVVTAGIAIAALVVGGVIGVGIGWKVEQNRVKDDVKNIRPVGKVVALTDDSITVALSTGGGRRTFALTDATVVDKAENGATADIEEGSTVFLRTRRGDDGKLEAAQVVVFPPEASANGQ